MLGFYVPPLGLAERSRSAFRLKFSRKNPIVRLKASSRLNAHVGAFERRLHVRGLMDCGLVIRCAVQQQARRVR
jgi:hypothetical protein